MNNQPQQTPLEDLRESALNHYDEISTAACHSSSDIPVAINHYYDTLIKQRDSEKHIVGFAKLMGVIFFVALLLTILTALLISNK